LLVDADFTAQWTVQVLNGVAWQHKVAAHHEAPDRGSSGSDGVTRDFVEAELSPPFGRRPEVACKNCKWLSGIRQPTETLIQSVPRGSALAGPEPIIASTTSTNLGRRAARMVEEGVASAEDIDTAIK
jgi:hypothetical protein